MEDLTWFRQGVEIPQKVIVPTAANDRVYPGIVPQDILVGANPRLIELQKKINAIVIQPQSLPDKYKDIPQLYQSVTSRTDFEDDSYKRIKALRLRDLKEEEIIEYGREMMSGLVCGVTQKLIGKIFYLAYQLKAPAGKGKTVKITPAMDELVSVTYVNLDFLENKVLEAAGDARRPIESGEADEIAQAYSYIAASMMKMFTRSPENYCKSWIHIMNGYSKFYGSEMPISGIVPDPSVIKCIHSCFAITEIFRSTLFRFLYNINGSNSAISLRRFLFDIHLSHTGTHIFPISFRLCATLNCSPHQLLSAIYAPRFDRQINELIEAIKLMKNADEKHSRQMWRYGRLFQSEFLSNLQTRACPKLVYLMACMLKQENPKSAENILQIRQLDEVSLEDRERCKIGAVAALKAVRAAVAQGNIRKLF